MTYKQIMMTTPDRSLCEPARVSGRRHEGKFKCNAREAGDNPYGPKVFLPPPPHPLHPLSASPNRPRRKAKQRSICVGFRARAIAHKARAAIPTNAPISCLFLAWTVRGSRKVEEGCGEEAKTAWGA